MEVQDCSVDVVSEENVRLEKVEVCLLPPNESPNVPIFENDDDEDERSSSPCPSSSPAVQVENNQKHHTKSSQKCSQWSVEKAKSLRNSGKSYQSQSKSKKHFSERKMRPPCGEKCRMECATKIDEAHRQKIFDSYWSTGDLQRQREFIAARMSPIRPKYRYSTTQDLRQFNNAFHFRVDGRDIRVCKTFFKSTLDINDRVIRTVVSKTTPEGFVELDLRGKHNKHPTVSPQVKESVREFIKTIPRIGSQSLRGKTSREFIDGSKNLTELYRDYKEYRLRENLPFASSVMFSKIFTNEFNISFFKPKKE